MQPPFASHAGTDWVLVTGQPGCGKTTAVKKLVEELRARGVCVRGFYTDEVLQGGRRIGFDIVSVPDGRRGPLARKGAAGPKVVRLSSSRPSRRVQVPPVPQPPAEPPQNLRRRQTLPERARPLFRTCDVCVLTNGGGVSTTSSRYPSN